MANAKCHCTDTERHTNDTKRHTTDTFAISLKQNDKA
jgi:hypothetical protein